MSNVISAFTADQVQRLTGLSARKLAEWDEIGFFQPTLAAENRKSPFSRVYTFRDVVGLRTLAILCKPPYRIRTSHLIEVAKRLNEYSEAPFAELSLYVVNGEVHFARPGSDEIEGVVSKQRALPLPLKNVWSDIERKAAKLKQRADGSIGKIEQHRYVKHNAAVIADTRIPVRVILSFVDDGYTSEQIIKEYPTLTEADIQAAISYRDGQKLTA